MKASHIIMMILFIWQAQATSAQIGAFSTAISTKFVVDELLKGLQSASARFDALGTSQQFQARNHILTISDNLSNIPDKILDKAFDELNRSQQLFFENLRLTINDWNNNTNLTLEKIEYNLSQVGDFMGTFPGSKTFPRVLKYTPSTYSGSETVQVRIKGSWLGYKTPVLMINNVSCLLESKTETELVFSYNATAAIDANCKGTNPVLGKLTVNNRRTLWQRITSIFSETTKKKYEYNIALYPIPEVAARYQVNLMLQRTTRETQRREESFFKENEHCAPAIPFLATVTTTGGWKIDMSSIDDSDHSARQECSYHGVRNKTDFGFELTGYIQNRGSCTFLGTKDARGAISVNVKFTEYRDVPIDVQANGFKRGSVKFGSAEYVEILPDTKSFSVILEKCDGTKSVLSGSDIASDEWFEVIKSGNSLSIKCKKASL